MDLEWDQVKSPNEGDFYTLEVRTACFVLFLGVHYFGVHYFEIIWMQFIMKPRLVFHLKVQIDLEVILVFMNNATPLLHLERYSPGPLGFLNMVS